MDRAQPDDTAIDDAMANQDAAALGHLLADDFIYTHSNGNPQPKADFISTILGRTSPPRRLLSDVHVELHGDIAVSRGNLDIIYHDARPNLYMRYVRVYRRLDAGWLAFSHRTVYAIDRNPPTP